MISFEDPADPDGGMPCFRRDSLPIAVLVADAPFHNGPSGSNAHAGITPVPASFEQATNELNNIGARVISHWDR